MKSKKFFFFILIQFVFIFGATPFVKAQTNDYSILKDNFDVSIDPITTRSSAYGVDISDLAVTDFRNLGIFGTTENSVVYYADVELKLIYNIYSKVDVEGADSTRYTYYSTTKKKWLDLSICKDPNLFPPPTSYYINARTFRFDYIPIKCSGITLNMNYNPLDERVIGFGGENLTATIPKTEAHFEKIIGVTYSSGDLAVYTDRFENLETEVKMSATDQTKDPAPTTELKDGRSSFENKIDSLNLGAFSGLITQEDLQAWEKQGITSGSTKFVNQQDSMSEDIPMSLQPRITKYKQQISVRYAKIYVLTQQFWFNTPGIWSISPVSQDDIFGAGGRTVGIHIDNYYIQQEITVKLKLFSTLNLNVPLSNTFLARPEIARGDFVWDLAVFGTTDVNVIALESTFDFFGIMGEFFANIAALFSGPLTIIIVIVVLVGLGYIFIQFVLPKLLRKRVASRMK